MSMRGSHKRRLTAVVAVVLTMLAVVMPADRAVADGDELVVVSLGDSYTSGNGAENYYGSDDCFRSYDSYPWRFVDRLQAASIDASIWHYACGGAVVSDIDGQINQVPSEVRGDAELVMLSIGGNDLGFSSIVAECLITSLTAFLCSSRIDDALEGGLDATIADTANALRSIADDFPNAKRIVLVGYPDLTSPDCGTLYSSTIGMIGGSYDTMQSTMISELNLDPTIRDGVEFEFAPLRALYENRGWCGDASITSTPPERWIWKVFEPSLIAEWVHPTAYGHDQTAEYLFGLGIHVFPEPLMCDGLVVTIDMESNGGNGVGTSGQDVIRGTNGADVIDGMGGNDIICARGGDDDIDGGDGNDRIWGQAGSDTIDAGDGNDRIYGGADADEINGGPGDDLLVANAGDDIVNGDAGEDRIYGGADSDTLHGGDDDDRVFGNSGDDELHGEGGADALYGSSGIDTLRGGPGDDFLSGSADADSLYGDDDTDTLRGGPGDDVLDGGPGDMDVAVGQGGDDALSGGDGVGDRCRGSSHVLGDTADATCESIASVP